MSRKRSVARRVEPTEQERAAFGDVIESVTSEEIGPVSTDDATPGGEEAPAILSLATPPASASDDVSEALSVVAMFREANIEPRVALHVAEGVTATIQAPWAYRELRSAYEAGGIEFAEQVFGFYQSRCNGQKSTSRDRQRGRLIGMEMEKIRAHARIRSKETGMQRRAA